MSKIQSHVVEGLNLLLLKTRATTWLLKERREKRLLSFLRATKSLLELNFYPSSLYLELGVYLRAYWRCSPLVLLFLVEAAEVGIFLYLFSESSVVVFSVLKRGRLGMKSYPVLNCHGGVGPWVTF